MLPRTVVGNCMLINNNNHRLTVLPAFSWSWTVTATLPPELLTSPQHQLRAELGYLLLLLIKLLISGRYTSPNNEANCAVVLCENVYVCRLTQHSKLDSTWKLTSSSTALSHAAWKVPRVVLSFAKSLHSDRQAWQPIRLWFWGSAHGMDQLKTRWGWAISHRLHIGT